MVSLVSSVIWAVVGFFVAKEMKEKHPDIEINEWLYGIGTFLFSFFLTMSFLGYKICKKTGNKNGSLIAVVVFVATVIINLFILF